MGSKDTMPNEHYATIRRIIDRSMDDIEQGRCETVELRCPIGNKEVIIIELKKTNKDE